MMYVLSFPLLLSSSSVPKSVSGISDLDIQLPERIQIIFLLLNTLKLKKIVPTEKNIVHCIRYGIPKYRHTDVTITLDTALTFVQKKKIALETALELQMILKLGLANFVLYFCRIERIWK